MYACACECRFIVWAHHECQSIKIRIQSMTDWFKLPLCTVCFLQRNLGYLSSWVRSLFADGFVTWSGRWGSLRAYFKEIRFRCFCKIGEDKLKTVIVVEKEKWTGAYNLCEQVCPNQRHARKATVSTAPGSWDSLSAKNNTRKLYKSTNNLDIF